MRLPTIFKIPRHQVFEFKPRYWNPEKEEFEARVERAKREVGKGTVIDQEGNYVPNIKGQMRGYMSSKFQTTRRKESQKANMRFVIILAILGCVAYYLFYM
jgi:hypothetical protein